MKKALIWIWVVLLSPVVIFLLLLLLIYLPPIQNFAIDKVTAYLSDTMDAEISVDDVTLAFPLDLSVNGVTYLQRNADNAALTDTVADVESIVAEVKLRPLLRGVVVVKRVEIDNAKINTADLVAEAVVRGEIGRIYLTSSGIHLFDGIAHVDDATLSDTYIDIQLNDTVVADTTTSEEPVNWQILVSTLDISNTSLTLHTAGDTMQISLSLGNAALRDGVVDLCEGRYSVDKISIDGSAVAYDDNMQPECEGLDPSHIMIGGVEIGLDSILYSDTETRATISQLRLKEKSGIEITGTKGSLRMDTATLYVPSIDISLPYSSLHAECQMDLSVMDTVNPGTMSANAMLTIGKQDITDMAAILSEGSEEPIVPAAFLNEYPQYDLTASIAVDGNMEQMNIRELAVTLPTALDISANGTARNLTDSTAMKADITIDAKTEDLGFVLAMMPAESRGAYQIPYGMTLTGTVEMDGNRYGADLTLTEGEGSIALAGQYNMDADAYSAQLDIEQMDLRHFMPGDSLKMVTANVAIDGKGFDPFSRRTTMEASLSIGEFGYGQYDIDMVDATASIDNGYAHIALNSDNIMMSGNIILDALISKERVDATLGVDLHQADFYMMRMTEKPFAVGVCAHVDVSSDLDQTHSLQATVSDLSLITEEKTYRPHDIEMDIYTDPDTIHAIIENGDFDATIASQGGYMRLMDQISALTAKMDNDREQKIIDGDGLRELLPTLEMNVRSGNDNVIANYLRMNGVDYADLLVDIASSPEHGLGGRAHIYSLNADSILLDTLYLGLRHDMNRAGLRAYIRNNKDNPQFVFTSLVDAYLEGRETGLNLKYIDADDTLGVSLGLVAEMGDSGISVHLKPYRPLLAYIPFNVNEDNYIFLGRDKRVRADVDIIADDGTGIRIHSNDADPTMLQDITVGLEQIDLAQLTSVVPYCPAITGVLDGEVRVAIDADENLSAYSTLGIDSLTYEKWPMGDLGANFSYTLREDSTHAVGASLTHNTQEVMALDGIYSDTGDGYIDATMSMTQFPLDIANGFVPDQIVGLGGEASGALTVEGPLSAPVVNGSLQLDSAYLESIPYGVTMRFDNDKVSIADSRLTFDNFNLFNPDGDKLVIKGYVDFSNMDNMSMDIAMMAQDYKIVDAKKTTKSLAYGKGYISFAGRMYGTMDDLKMRGKLNVLGNTDLTYILKNTPLTAENSLEGLVTFTNFSDTAQVASIERPPLGGFDMEVTLEIESGARIVCALNTDESNYVNLMGGGELTLTYNDLDDMQLFGKYTLTEGEMKYQLPVIPLKTFTIEEGSYVEFTGEMMNPTLNITATEDIKALVSSETGESRSVLFQCGVKVTQTLENMGLEFTLDTEDDMTIKNELATKSAEDRGKLAVTMLTTGMYITGDNSSGFSMNNALNSFLQNEINNITNSAVRTFDLSLGVDQGTGESGEQYTDYTFKFSKRLWNNRFNFIIGGKVSDGSSGDDSGTMIDNVSLEYRLDNTAMRYLRLFYTRDTHDILEDDVSEYGGGFVWRKKMNSFSELFKSTKSTEKKEQEQRKAALTAKNEEATATPDDNTATPDDAPATPSDDTDATGAATPDGKGATGTVTPDDTDTTGAATPDNTETKTEE